jgi:hypothetical protein
MLAAPVPEFRRTVDVVVVAGSAERAGRARLQRGSCRGDFAATNVGRLWHGGASPSVVGPDGRERRSTDTRSVDT